MKNCCAVVFDKDATLLDFNATWGGATVDLFRELCGKDQGKLECLAADAGVDLRRRQVRAESDLVWQSTTLLIDQWHRYFADQSKVEFHAQVSMRYRELTLGTARLLPGVKMLLVALREAGFTLVLNTNDHITTAEQQLRATGIIDLFHSVYGCDSGFGVKPAPGVLIEIAKRLSCPPSALVMVGDSIHDMQSARLAGAIAVAVCSEFGCRPQLLALSDYFIDDLTQLLAILSK